MFRTLLLIFGLIVPLAYSSASDSFSVEDYGTLPDMRSLSISPDGQHYAYIKKHKEVDVFVVINTESGKLVGGARSGDIKARGVYFATNKHVILMGSQTRRSNRIRGKWENSAAVSYNIETDQMKVLLNRERGLYLAQSGLGQIVGLNEKEETAYMPAYTGRDEDPPKDLMRISLNTGRGQIHAKGTHYTRDWFVDRFGNVLAREDYDEDTKETLVLSYTSGEWKVIYNRQSDGPSINLLAVSPDNEHLMFKAGRGQNESVYRMALTDGAISGPLYDAEGKDIDHILTTGMNREFAGVKYSGLLPEYQYEDASKMKHLADIQEIFPTSSVTPLSATRDWSKIVFRVSGNEAAQDYMIYTPAERNARILGSGYPAVSKENIGAIKAMRYKARDGLPITAIVTWPVNVEEPSNLPMLVMPHGGPARYDSISFHWRAQYFARRGYLVLQPNFRGSSGFGRRFQRAGDGKWGKEMQDDVSDGVRAMVDAGYADPSRVCIVGSSYGGYSALAGGAFTPELYRCVVSIGGVSDLPLILRKTKSRYGRKHWANRYWGRLIGDSKTEKEKLKNISPANFARNFQAPVLLLHGKDDTVVHIEQSKRMAKKLRRAKKDVTLITLRGEDHWLSDSDTRLQLLDSIDKFLELHNPPDR